MHSTKPFLSPREFYRAFGNAIGLSTIYELLRGGQIRALKVGNHYRIPKSELEDFPARIARGEVATVEGR